MNKNPKRGRSVFPADSFDRDDKTMKFSHLRVEFAFLLFVKHVTSCLDLKKKDGKRKMNIITIAAIVL